MSWSVSASGKPADVAAAIDTAVARYGPGQSRDEFEEAAPHLKGLVACAGPEQTLTVSASGHATFVDGKKTYGAITASITTTG